MMKEETKQQKKGGRLMLSGMIGVVYSLILQPGYDLTFSGDLGRPGPRLIILGIAVLLLVTGIGCRRGWWD